MDKKEILKHRWNVFLFYAIIFGGILLLFFLNGDDFSEVIFILLPVLVVCFILSEYVLQLDINGNKNGLRWLYDIIAFIPPLFYFVVCYASEYYVHKETKTSFFMLGAPAVEERIWLYMGLIPILSYFFYFGKLRPYLSGKSKSVFTKIG